MGEPDPGLFSATCLGYWQVGLGMLAIGMVASFLTNNLTIAYILGLVFNLPLSYKARIEGVEGVKRVSINAWFGGSLPAEKEEVDAEDSSSTTDWSNFFPNLAVEPEPFLAMYPEYELPPDQFQAFLQDLRGCVIGRKLADKYGWEVSDTEPPRSALARTGASGGPYGF